MLLSIVHGCDFDEHEWLGKAASPESCHATPEKQAWQTSQDNGIWCLKDSSPGCQCLGTKLDICKHGFLVPCEGRKLIEALFCYAGLEQDRCHGRHLGPDPGLQFGMHDSGRLRTSAARTGQCWRANLSQESWTWIRFWSSIALHIPLTYFIARAGCRPRAESPAASRPFCPQASFVSLFRHSGSQSQDRKDVKHEGCRSKTTRPGNASALSNETQCYIERHCLNTAHVNLARLQLSPRGKLLLPGVHVPQENDVHCVDLYLVS